MAYLGTYIGELKGILTEKGSIAGVFEDFKKDRGLVGKVELTEEIKKDFSEYFADKVAERTNAKLKESAH
ncbi:hypothetical protein SP15_236 [Bacillus phage SP-15]|uniref:Uncharacterized protein n=1 Tax=Bacillus phage SP-15 TaxID=1792032 RepID=A0A127AWG5_9CAUD|nr:hypothetical protein SP15_236 [Bacillus phage SP-15]AMM45039.1 hypothetical protein SP15_236 [Bacillus phage SP-15]